MNNVIRDTVDAFLEDWQAWALSGNVSAPSPAGAKYMTHRGLCRSIEDYVTRANDADTPIGALLRDVELVVDCRNEFAIRFAARHLDQGYPFGKEAYTECALENRMHKDINRLTFVQLEVKAAQDRRALEASVQEVFSDAEFNADPMPTWFWTTVITILVVIIVSVAIALPAKAETPAYPRLTVSSCSSIEPASEIDNAIECNTKVYSLMAYDMDFCYMLEKSIKGQNASLETECEFIH